MEEQEKLFNARLEGKENVRWFQALTEGLNKYLTECHFSISEDGIHLRQLDSSKALQLELMFSHQFFSEYEYNYEEEPDLPLCLDAEQFYKIAKGAEEALELHVKRNPEGERPMFTFTMVTETAYRSNIELQLLTPPEAKSKPPKLSFEASFRINADVFKDAISEFKEVTNHLVMSVEDAPKIGRIIRFFGEGDKGKVDLEFQERHGILENIALIDLETEDDPIKVKAMYARNYLDDFWKFTPRLKSIYTDTWVHIAFATDRPLLAVIDKPGQFTLSWIAAPRVEKR